MSRYDFDPEDYRAPVPPAKQKSAPKNKNAEPEHGRGGSGGVEQPKSKSRPERARSRERGNRRPRQDRDREYNLRESEVATLITIAKFRTVRTVDLVEIQYNGDSVRAAQDLRNLTAQGLIQRRTLAGTEKDQLLTVTRQAREFLEHKRPQKLAANQSLHHGFVKPREARHDAALYRLYQKAAKKIEKEGGGKLRVVLDYELKRDIHRDRAKLKSLPPSEQSARQEEIARDHGLRVVDGKIPLPDLRIEYETRDHEQARVDLELATRDYRGNQLAEKGKAGFSIYAPADDAARVRAAAQDPHLILEILSL
jgi:DNA-binding MarR family transcriptional regulator